MRAFLSTLLLLASLSIHAIPAQRIWKTYVRADGTTVRAMLVGDEHMHYYLTEDHIPMQMKQGMLVMANQSAEQLAEAHQQAVAEANRRRNQLGQRTTEYKGKRKALVILADFSDKTFMSSTPAADYEQILNEVGYSQNGALGSVHDYFYAQSNGTFDLTFDIVGPIRAQHPYSYYGKNTDGRGNDAHAVDLVNEVCAEAAKQRSFKDYDWDQDGTADLVYVIYAGYGEATGGDESTIWPHQSTLDNLEGGAPSYGGVRMGKYACSNERTTHKTGKGLAIREEDVIMGIGVICHEFSHCLGLPDFYDIRYGGNLGMLTWSLMCQGSYNGPKGLGWLPVGYTAYERNFCGWLDYDVLGSQPLQVNGMLPLGQKGAKAYIMYNPDNHNEYYLLENRKAEGWYEYDEGEGLLVTHVDYDADVWQNNIANTTVAGYNNHERYVPIPAGGDVKNLYRTPYPAGEKDSLTATSQPALTLYNKTRRGETTLMSKLLHIALRDNGTIDFSYVPAPAVTSAIHSVEATAEGHITAVHNLQGVYVSRTLDSLPTGIYIVTYGDGSRRKVSVRP